jgi:hypothetical protein
MARSELVQLRVDGDTKARWQAAAEDAGYRLSEWIRETCDTAALGERADHGRKARSRSAAAKGMTSRRGGAPPKGPSEATEPGSVVGFGEKHRKKLS